MTDSSTVGFLPPENWPRPLFGHRSEGFLWRAVNLTPEPNSDRTIAGLTLLFAATILMMRWVFGLPNWDATINQVYSLIMWFAMLLMVGTMLLAVRRLANPDRTPTGGVLALVRFIHAPNFLGMRFGLVELETMFMDGRVSQTGMYPALSVLAMIVLVRRFFMRPWGRRDPKGPSSQIAVRPI